MLFMTNSAFCKRHPCMVLTVVLRLNLRWLNCLSFREECIVSPFLSFVFFQEVLFFLPEKTGLFVALNFDCIAKII